MGGNTIIWLPEMKIKSVFVYSEDRKIVCYDMIKIQDKEVIKNTINFIFKKSILHSGVFLLKLQYNRVKF